MNGVAVIALAALAFLALSKASASTGPRALEQGKRYRFTAVVRPAFSDEGSAQAQAFLAAFGSQLAFNQLELERVDNFPGESRVVFVATMATSVDLALPDTVFELGGLALTITGARAV